ncbi:MAG TPA: enoyl-CoA hydratase/isomerase family protein [Steroidobacteraceae bacterium]|nr:enoyl-CoA hydratase/isomerase family protein [Steroidobacteraceae bacterium]
MPRLDAHALLAAALAGGEGPCSSLLGVPLLIVDLDPHPSCDRAQQSALAHWLRRQACPVLGVAAPGTEHPWAAACDAVVSTQEQAAALAANVLAAPLAAMVLVQLLRVTEGMEVAAALTVESLAFATLQGGPEFRTWLGRAPRPAGAPAAESGPPVRMEREGAQLHVCLNRPARRNALSLEMRDALVEALELMLTDRSLAGATISGAGSCFCAGGDLAEFGSAADPATAHAVRSTRSVPALLARCAERLTFRVHGAAVGAGVEMAAFGGRVVASADTFFQLPEIGYGLIPGSGGCVSLPRRIGRLRTAELALSTRRLDAHTARVWGLVDELVEPATRAQAADG